MKSWFNKAVLTALALPLLGFVTVPAQASSQPHLTRVKHHRAAHHKAAHRHGHKAPKHRHPRHHHGV